MSKNRTLTLAASSKPIDKFILGEVLAFAKSTDKRWLADDMAVDIAIETPPDSTGFMRQMRKICDPYKIDVFLTAPENRRKKLLIADMDSTIVETETLDDLAAHFDLKDKVAAITARAMNGDLDFHAAVTERVALLQGLPVFAIHDAVADTRVNKGANALVSTMKNNGARCYLVSSGFTHFTAAIADQLGFDGHHGNVFDMADDTLTGKIIMPIQDKDSKVTHLNHYTNAHNLNLSQTLSIGDGANDIPMLKTSEDQNGLGIGYYAKPVVAGQLLNVIRFGDLTAALYAQGYKDSEIVG